MLLIHPEEKIVLSKLLETKVPGDSTYQQNHGKFLKRFTDLLIVTFKSAGLWRKISLLFCFREMHSYKFLVYLKSFQIFRTNYHFTILHGILTIIRIALSLTCDFNFVYVPGCNASNSTCYFKTV